MKVRCAGLGGRLAFEGPREIIEARHPNEVAGAFARIEAARAAGRYVAGFASYELGAAFVPRQALAAHPTLPLLCMGVFDTAHADDGPRARAAAAVPGPLVPLVSRTRYERDLARIASAIREGDVYQVNYAIPFGFSYAGEPEALYDALTASAAYPYAAYVETASYAILSASPELFVRREGGRIATKPMKGTAGNARRGDLASPKNRAEHVMIVDLLRNDLHRLGARHACGDVEVSTFAEIERYPGYETMTSTIGTAVRDDQTLEGIFTAMFPCGSVTGAPKVAAMRLIAATERSERGIFCGAVGSMAPDRSGIWNVAIRTALLDRATRRGTLRVGGGIVADSTVEEELAEITVKRSFFARLTPAYSLLETLRREPDGTYPDLAAHLSRLCFSADALQFAFDRERATAALAAVRADGPALVRLVLAPDGSVSIEARPLERAGESVAICWARDPLDETEPLLRHKTTWRPHYDAAFAQARRAGCFDAILCNTRGEIADGSRSTLFVRRAGELLTPPLRSGALPGVLRERLLRARVSRVAVLRPGDLQAADELFVGNAARGLIRAHLISTTTVRREPIRAVLAL